MITKRFYRNSQALLAFITLAVLAVSFYFQYAEGMEPCPLCIMQRIMIFFLLFFTLVGIRINATGRAILVTAGQMVFSVFGMYFSGRQLWLQSLPADNAPACMPGLEVLMKYFPVQDLIHALLWGAGDCAKVSWRMLGVTMPGWSLFYFIGMFLAAAILYVRLLRANSEKNTL